MPPTPRSTLFPYTTLFRSEEATRPGAPQLYDHIPNNVALDYHYGDTADRKSTRLNSSHGYISYAVFCLKKKRYFANTLDSRTTYHAMRLVHCLAPQPSSGG